jgi:hypothetical protein
MAMRRDLARMSSLPLTATVFGGRRFPTSDFRKDTASGDKDVIR